MPASPARRVAFDILLAVDQRGAFFDELLHSARMDVLDTRDRALATEIVLGVLRRRGELDWMIERAARRKVAKLDPEVVTAARIGAYQLRRLERIPAHAAVSDSVELIKAAGKPRAAGLVNAVLRRLPKAPDDRRAEELNYPNWLLDRWRKSFGEGACRGILANGLVQPPSYVRLSARYPAGETIKGLRVEGVELEATDVTHAYRVTAGRVAGSAAERDGRVRIQDVGSQSVVPLLGLQPGHRFLDLCAAPGGKTAQAVDLLGGPNGVVACDRHPARLRILKRLSAEPVDLLVCDAARPLPLRRPFDRVLVDAPCSGTGTLAHNPDIKWRLRPQDLPDLQRRQAAILRTALSAVADGGAAVYATCSLEPEENDQVIDQVLSAVPAWRVTERMQRIPGRDEGDGFFAVRLERA